MTTTGEPTAESTAPASAGPAVGARVRAIPALTGIRAVAAGWVVVHHFRDPIFDLLPALRFLAPPVRCGYLGVEVFFVLSGFIIAHNYAERVRSGRSYRSYLWARAARMYPVHLVTTVMMVGLVLAFPADEDIRAATTTVNVSGSVFLLQAVPGFRGANGPSWSISCEVVAYLVFPLIAWWALRLSSRAALTWAAVVLTGGLGAIVWAGIGERSMDMPLLYPVIWLRIATEFTVGVLLWAWWRGRPRDSARWDVAAVTGVAGTVAVTYLVPATSSVAFLALPFITLFVVSCASATGPVHRALSSRVMQWGGRVSYSLYMTHFVVFRLLNELIPWHDYEDAGLPLRMALLAVTMLWITGVAAALYHLVEEPARRRAAAWWARRQGAHAR